MQRNDSLVSIQSRIRGLIARDKYIINPLPDNKLTDHKTYSIGNDPDMPQELNTFNEPHKKIALIATSGMRAVWIACLLGNKIQIPKIFLIDNSEKVHKFWEGIRSIIQTAQNQDDFIFNLEIFLIKNEDVCYNEFELPDYFRVLFDSYSFDYIRRIILHTSLIKQSWADTETFIKIKNFIELHKITKTFLYPSNIVSCENPDNYDTILKNIEQLSPVLTIHTDLSLDEHPKNVFLITDQNPEAVKKILFHKGSIPGLVRSLHNSVPVAIQLSQNTTPQVILIPIHVLNDVLNTMDLSSDSDSYSENEFLNLLTPKMIPRKNELPLPPFDLERLNQRYREPHANVPHAFFQAPQKEVEKKTYVASPLCRHK